MGKLVDDWNDSGCIEIVTTAEGFTIKKGLW